MFDITPDDIFRLNDIDLRELVGRLCAADLSQRSLSPAAVTWGGNQTAADGGLDVRVSLPAGSTTDGFIPRPATGYQVKKPDLPRAEIIREMCPGGTVRPVIQSLANEGGAYIIVSSTGSTADAPLNDRRAAMRQAVAGMPNADQLHTDFYDRTRLATWVKTHPGLIAWVKEKVGRGVNGWRPFGPWAGGPEGADSEYLIDDQLRLHLGTHRDPARSVISAIDDVRDELQRPGSIVRLVGLSGVGKTRFVQALFDSRIGSRALPPSFAVYTNLSDNPDPQPVGLASDLIASRARAILIVDNCPPDLHRRLSETCTVKDSTVSVITVEYDVRDDQPEGTRVITLETSSVELIQRLLERRHPDLPQVSARTIADASGGNARIAIALAGTVERTENVAGLSNDELFQRLFRQRHEANDALLRTAQACSLLYSFNGEIVDGEEAELPRLAALVDQSTATVYRHVGELFRRDLVQQRGIWRAVLPHAIANSLASHALQDIPYELIERQILGGKSGRLTRSFSRRLSFLHDHPKAVAIVNRWLSPDGLVGKVTALNELGRAIFQNVAPVLPEVTLGALERSAVADADGPAQLRPYLSTIRSLAYDAQLFDRSADLLQRIALTGSQGREAEQAASYFTSLFTLRLSGTHATIEQRLAIVERLMRSDVEGARKLAMLALAELLKTGHFSSHYHFEFGARPRDYGYLPRTIQEVTLWYSTALVFVERLAATPGMPRLELQEIVARGFRGLWRQAAMRDNLERLFRKFAADDFWREGWVACKQTLKFDKEKMPPEVLLRLAALEAELKPTDIASQVRGIVLGKNSVGLDLLDFGPEDIQQAMQDLEAKARELGTAVVADDSLLAELLPDVLLGGTRAWAFGRGLAAGARDHWTCWKKFIQVLEVLPRAKRDVQMMRGFLAELSELKPELPQELLEDSVDQPCLHEFLPVLYSSGKLDERGIQRLMQVLRQGLVQVEQFRPLAWGRSTDHLTGESFKELLLLIADQPDGFDVALEILSMRFFTDKQERRSPSPELTVAGKELLRRVTFKRHNHSGDFHLAGVVQACLAGPESSQVAAEVAVRLRQAIASFETHSFDHDDLLRSLLQLHPFAVLDALFSGTESDLRDGVSAFDHLSDHRPNATNAIPSPTLVEWCDSNSEQRYALAAAIITFSRKSEGGPQVWSEQASALLASAPDPQSVLREFVSRFRPSSWSGSLAAIMESYIPLLDTLEPAVASRILPFVNEARARLVANASAQREQETREDKARDERFE